MSKIYNRNIGYEYPLDKNKFEEELKLESLTYLLSKGYIKLNK